MPFWPYGMDTKFRHRFGDGISPFIELSRGYLFR